MTKRMLIDDTHPEETRVVIVNGNKVEDVEFESSSRKQIKGNIYLAKVMRIEPSLQAAFVDYGGNKHGFLAFGEIHPDYYNISDTEMAEVDKEVDEIIEAKKQALKEREEQRERQRAERAERRAQYEARKAQEEAEKAAAEATQAVSGEDAVTETSETPAFRPEERSETAPETKAETEAASAPAEEENITETAEEEGKKTRKRRILKKRYKKKLAEEHQTETEKEGLKVLSESTGTEEESVSEEISEMESAETEEPVKTRKTSGYMNDEEAVDDDDEEDQEYDFELQRKLLKVRKLFHRSNIQDVIKEGQILIVQVVKEERGNKGAALTTYLSLAGRYCVLMPNRIKSGGVSRKITNAADRKRLKSIVRELPLTSDMSMIVRTAGEDKTKADIVRDYNYLIRSWNQIRLAALSNKAPALIHEEGNLIKRALRDMYTKEISEIIVDGDEAYQMARDFVKILSPHNLKKIKSCKKNDIPLFQRFQVEGQLDKLHDCNVQLESGGYLVINPTEALVAIDVNSGRATKEKDLEETALKTNLEACDEIARQLRMRNLAGLVVIDFIDMDEPANNHAVERRMKEALKRDRSRVQVGKMSCFGLLEISRQRMHSSFMESNYVVCPHCRGQGVVRTVESGAVLVLRGIEEEGIKNRSSQLNVFVPTDVAIYLLNQKRQNMVELEQKYKMNVIISADDSIKNIADYRIERIKAVKIQSEEKKAADEGLAEQRQVQAAAEETAETGAEVQTAETESENNVRRSRRERSGRNRRERGRRDRPARSRRDSNAEVTADNPAAAGETTPAKKEKQEPVILYNSHGNNISKPEEATKPDGGETKEKSTWWKKLIKG